MTNEQRDELLITIAKGLNNLQGAFNDFRVEIRAELNTKVDALDQKFTSKIDALDQKFTSKIDALDQKFTSKIDALEKDNAQIKSDLSTLAKSKAEFKEETKAHFEALEKSQAEFKEETKANFKAASEVVRDIFKTNYEADQHLKRHDIEIHELQSKLA